MSQLAQNINLPMYGNVSGPPGFKSGEFTNLGSLVGNSLDLFFILATFIALTMLVWGAVRYIFAGGEKQGLESARKRMTWAIIGLIITALAFAIAQYIEGVLMPTTTSPISLVTTAYAQGTTPVPLSEVYGFGNQQSLGGVISQLLPTVFSIAMVGVVFYFLLGGIKYLTSGGSKESTSSARNMITHAIVGFVILMMVFLVMQFIPEFFGFDFSLF